MSRRRRAGRDTPGPILAIGALLVTLLLLDRALDRLVGLFLFVVAAAAVTWLIRRIRRVRGGPVVVRPRKRRSTWANARSRTTGPPPAMTADQAEIGRLTAERDQLQAEAGDLRRRLAEAQDHAHAAWDAAANVTPRQHPETGPVTRLLADPLSGARRLGDQR